MTNGRGSITNLVWYRHRLKQLTCKLYIKIFTKEYTILWFEFDLFCLHNQGDATDPTLYNSSSSERIFQIQEQVMDDITVQ